MNSTDSLQKLIECVKTKMPVDDVDSCYDLMKNYNGDDWKNYVCYKDDNYNRALVYKDDNFDLRVISWNVKQSSPFHDHANNGCLFKVLDGSVKETRKDDKSLSTEMCCGKGDVNYISNKLGIHKIESLYNKTAVTLHLYSPPDYQCNIIDE